MMTDAQMIDDPLSWPNLVLPLKYRGAKPRADGHRAACVLGKTVDGKIAVKLANMWDAVRWTEAPITYYDNAQDILDEGWQID